MIVVSRKFSSILNIEGEHEPLSWQLTEAMEHDEECKQKWPRHWLFRGLIQELSETCLKCKCHDILLRKLFCKVTVLIKLDLEGC